MIAIVVKVEFNQQLGKYKVTKLTVKAENGKLNTHNIFPSSPYNNLVRDLQPGDTINLTMEKKGDYWNVANIERAQASSAGNISPIPQKQYGGSVRQEESTNKDLAIARAVTIKAATEVYAAMIGAGLTKKTLKPEAAAEEVLALCKKFEGYLTLSEDLNDLVSDSSSISKEGGGDFEERPFD